jgi:hypothetical protein
MHGMYRCIWFTVYVCALYGVGMGTETVDNTGGGGENPHNLGELFALASPDLVAGSKMDWMGEMGIGAKWEDIWVQTIEFIETMLLSYQKHRGIVLM